MYPARRPPPVCALCVPLCVLCIRLFTLFHTVTLRRAKIPKEENPLLS